MVRRSLASRAPKAACYRAGHAPPGGIYAARAPRRGNADRSNRVREWTDLVSSVVARIEVLRALRRARVSDVDYRRGRDVLARLVLVRLDDQIADAAANLAPAELRALDAIHLASALSVKEDLAGIVTYDTRLARASRGIPLKVWSPG
jgi:predicted nucleic acid-binding protein